MAQKPRVFTHRMRVKLVVSFIILLSIFTMLIGRLTYISVKSGKRYEKKVLAQQNYTSKTLPYARGEIRDRNGTPLATSVKVYNLILEPKNILSADSQRNKSVKEKENPEQDVYQKATIVALTKFFDVTEEELTKVITENPDSYYQKVLKKLTYDEVKPFKEYLEKKQTIKNADGKEQTILRGDRVKGVYFEEEYKRSYPNSTLASNVIGFSNSGNVGCWGLEQQYNDKLNGINGREYGYINDDTQLERTTKAAQNGYNLVSTLDVNVQRIAEKHIKKFMKKTGAAEGVNVLVMNPNNGDVLAMATDGTYDLNNPRDEALLKTEYSASEIKKMTDEEKINAFNQLWRNEQISKIYEPGSTFKPFTIAAGLEENLLTGNETYNCTGNLQKEGWPKPINCHKTEGHGIVTLSGALEESCNVAMMRMNDVIGKKIFTQYESNFCFGRKTGIDLPGEELGLIIKAENMGSSDLATNSFGQNIDVTMVQLGSAFCSLINGGYYYKPHLVKQVVNSNGGIVENMDKILVKNTVSRETSDWIKESLYQTVERGTGKEAQIEGYKIGGKTGTAEKLPRKNGKYLVSFISFLPVDKPELMIYVTIDEPQVTPQSQSGYAVRLCHDITKELVTYMNIPQTKDTKTTKTKKST